MNNIDIIEFLKHSNWIEGEVGLNPGDEKAFELAICEITILEEILEIHKLLTQHLKVNWSGKWRVCNVRVGDYVAPQWEEVPQLMKEFMEKLPSYNSYHVYCEFEKIHAFRDFNGRVGRLIWVSKKLDEGWDFERSFLEQFHYDSLSNYKEI